ncbi:putative CCA tRNA nucleotidyltransferase 2 isoform X1 [Carex littledalei]|uniref:Putative CCA tRNA nucleotidyltransferase 2 isoform X1 n=1 Tax=Carex littledalei TaxID=544730 RepID=A0A833QWG2_9POAL|nr:putative CCA tRNA nucleotidyltransferase 2 isoform X1 [Carex littledalei]
MDAAPVVLPVKEHIELSEKEDKIFTRLLDVVRHFGLETQLRVAGGWVRDKLLGKECYDIDIALDNMLGRDFCEKVNEYLKSVGEQQQGIGVIQCNPDQSKHLETAKMRIYDIWIDFVNLRSETYAENSRIPTMKFGTAEEDAYRRDLTINSLFYNINNSSIEDLTGRGVKDLKSGLIVTPLPPKATFMDDPLRVLRAIRFGARFGFLLDEELKKAASDEEVRSALGNKISKERIGHEVDLMMSDKQPPKAMAWICDLKLFFVVFACPENSRPPVDEHCDRLCISHIEAAWLLLQAIGTASFTEDQRRLCLYSSLLLPLRSTIYMDKKLREVNNILFAVFSSILSALSLSILYIVQAPVAGFIFRESLKLKASDADMVVNLHNACKKFVELFLLLESDEIPENIRADLEDEFLEIPCTSIKRVFAGLLLRQLKDFWRVALMTSTLLDPALDPTNDSSDRSEGLNRRREMFLRAESAITQLGLDGVWKTKPLLDGKGIMGVLQLKSGGPTIGQWQHRLIKWQLAYPNATTEDCIDWINQSQAKRQKLDINA